MRTRNAASLLKLTLLLSTLALGACGFHLRRSAALPPSMQRLHLTVSGGNSLQRNLARALEGAGVTVEDDAAPGVAEFKIPVARFNTDTLNLGGYSQITEYAVRYEVQFQVNDANGQPLLPLQRINMAREFSYDALNAIGTQSQVEEIQRSLNDDMVQAILLRLQAAARHAPVAPAPASSR
ncbi:LPS assembly lipoprotein LptE [Frateuria defendens]|uniref:LPS-assembly lipoprotein LptE n=1 Tax=Frateuria defendens TaxID=2219559 RepID=UPI00066FE9DC|nr:LPS assembly lipoprotein LptE [Frateuria defendens]